MGWDNFGKVPLRGFSGWNGEASEQEGWLKKLMQVSCPLLNELIF